MSKIVIDGRELRTSTGRYVERLLHYLQTIDRKNDYTVLLKPKDMDGWQPTSTRFTKVACPYREFSFEEQLGYRRQLVGLKPDLVHFPIVQQPVLYRGKTVTTMNDLTTTRFRNPTKNRLVFTIKQSVYKWLNHRVAKKANALITYSEFVKSDVAQYAKINPAKITVTPLAADAFDEPEMPIEDFEDKDFIMFNGRPLPHKNLRRLIEAFSMLQSKYPDLHLMIAGKKDRSHTSYLKQAEQLGIANRVTLTDWITDGQLKWAMRHTKAYVYPSLSEGFGLPPLEAMLNGAPVVASNATCIPEVCGEAAHYFDPLDTQAMADAINEVLTNKNLRDELIRKGKDQVAKYSWKRMAEQTLAVYNQVLND